jgi:hypothetical protein
MDRDSHAALVALNRFGFGARGGALGRIPKPARGAIHATARYDDAGSLAQSGRPGCACLDPENDQEPSFLRSSMSPFLLAFSQSEAVRPRHRSADIAKRLPSAIEVQTTTGL